MQVAQQNDFITHAVIGGGKSIDFGISNSAEFFNILSSTLYKDQILAVVREVLCNAWDAHIEGGCTDTPVQITLDEEKLVVKDFGRGIHHDDMGLIYGTYGNSTKKNDGKQTGGFGLGCKAPFAYTDHFEVQSSHDGVRTIYSLSKSSAQTNGKPAIVPIASFPSSDHGLQVTIPIHSLSDRRRYHELIKRIARNGDMNMTFNGKAIDKLGFDTTVANYLVTAGEYLLDNETSVMVRYGNVVYPIDSVKEIGGQLSRITTHLGKMKHGSRDYRLVLQAPPHSISVTPSRESLSMQEQTIKTLVSLLEGFLESLDSKFDTACNAFAEQVVVEAVIQKKMGALLSTDNKLPGIVSSEFHVNIRDLDTMARRYMVANYPDGFAFRKKDIEHRLRTMAAAGLIDRGLTQTYIRDLVKVDSWHGSTCWLSRQVTGPLLAKMQAAGMDLHRLMVVDYHEEHVSKRSDSTYQPMWSARNARIRHHFSAMPYLRKIVVVSTSGKDVTARAYREDLFQTNGCYGGFLFYQCSMKKADREGALQFFRDAGMNVVDLTVSIDYAAAAAARKANVGAPRKPAKKGVPSMAGMLCYSSKIDPVTKAMVKQTTPNGKIETKQVKLDDAPRVEHPEAAILVHFGKDDYKDRVGPWDEKATSHIARLLGDKIGVTINSVAYDKLVKAGVRPFKDYIREKVCTHVENSAAIQEYWAFNPSRACKDAGLNEDDYTQERTSVNLVKAIYSHAGLRAKFNLVNNMTQEDRMYVYLWNAMCKRAQDHKYRGEAMPAEISKVYRKLKAIPMHPANAALLAKFNNNPLLNILDREALMCILKLNTNQGYEKAIQLLMTVLDN